jgi:hypothetical protein
MFGWPARIKTLSGFASTATVARSRVVRRVRVGFMGGGRVCWCPVLSFQGRGGEGEDH